mmetsp:Transcript_61835/g.85018  ORF Transcript_61835/g.85018 Transcript_61835/m.85018 type:complete len:103 (-) Transcript_61835:31-339(-)
MRSPTDHLTPHPLLQPQLPSGNTSPDIHDIELTCPCTQVSTVSVTKPIPPCISLPNGITAAQVTSSPTSRPTAAKVRSLLANTYEVTSDKHIPNVTLGTTTL